MSELTLADCKVGEKVTLEEIHEKPLRLQLFSMGCLVGEHITIERIAPFGDPIVISIEDSFISLRRNIAKKMQVCKTNVHDSER